MIFPYRTRRFLKRAVTVLLVLTVVCAVVLLCWMLWLNRFLVYTRDGVKLNFDLPPLSMGGQPAVKPSLPDVDIYYNEGENALVPETTDLTQLVGYYVSTQALTTDFAAVEAQIRTLPVGSTVMLDVKNIRGRFYYSSALGASSEAVDPAAMDRLISYLRQNNFYLIARLPAFRDFQYGLDHVDFGIFNPNRLSLWWDEAGCYWLHPGSEGTLAYLVQIIGELKEKGFDEVVLEDFRFPDTNNIYLEGDRTEILTKTAQSLVKICATETFAVSFHGSDPAFPLPEGRSRLYLTNVAAADAENAAQQSGLEDPAVRLVFLTELMDTRYEDYGVLRPVDTAQ